MDPIFTKEAGPLRIEITQDSSGVYWGSRYLDGKFAHKVELGTQEPTESTLNYLFTMSFVFG